MELEDLLEKFRTKITPDQNRSIFAKETSMVPALVYPILQAMSVKEQINCIKASHIFKNAFIDLINLEAIPQAILDHQTGTVLPIDEDSVYPNSEGQKYTIIKNMKYIVENKSFTYRTFSDMTLYSHKFRDLLQKYTYCNATVIRDDLDDDDCCGVKLMRTIVDYLVNKIWTISGDVEKREQYRLKEFAAELKRACKEIFYSELDHDISSLEYLEDLNNNEEEHSIDEITMMSDFIEHATRLGIEEFDSSMYDEIRTIMRQDIDRKTDILVEKLSNYTLSDLYADKDGVFGLNLISEYPLLFTETTEPSDLLDLATLSLAKVDYYFQHGEYVNPNICNVFMTPIPGIDVCSVYGIFPHIKDEIQIE
jgi:hypothetical protein